MFLASKDRSSLFNAEQIVDLYIGEDHRTVKAAVGPREVMYRLGTYRSEAEAIAAVRILAERIGEKKEIVYMPADDEAETAVRRENARPERFSSDGKKPVRRGGS